MEWNRIEVNRMESNSLEHAGRVARVKGIMKLILRGYLSFIQYILNVNNS